MSKNLKNLLHHLDLDLDLDLNQKIADHQDYDSLLHLDLITYLSNTYDIEVEDSEQFCAETSFYELSKLLGD